MTAAYRMLTESSEIYASWMTMETIDLKSASS